MYGTHEKERERDLVVNPKGRFLLGRCGRSGAGFKWLRIQNRGGLSRFKQHSEIPG
jgi:hypothetical protein